MKLQWRRRSNTALLEPVPSFTFKMLKELRKADLEAQLQDGQDNHGFQDPTQT